MYCTLYFTIFPDRSPALDRSAASWYNIEIVATNLHMYALVLANYIEKERADTMKLINTMTSILAAGAVLSAFAAAAASAESAETSETAETAETSAFGTTGAWSDIAGETSTSYDNLFDVILVDKYSDIWYKYCAAVAGEDNAEEAAASLKGSISSDAYGQEALDRIAETGAAAFDCWYINGAAQFTFNSDLTATVTLTDGNESTHAYEYLGQYNVGDGETLSWGGVEMPVAFPCDVYKSTDDAGEFTYFFFRDDTMADTYHIEFRYGSDLEELQGYLKGSYAYWLSAGIDAAADLHTIDNCIGLFCLENSDFPQRTDSSIAQISDLVGTWDADLSGFGEDFADTGIHFTIDASGHGETFMNGEKTRDFSAYMYDSGDKGDGEGLYVAYDNEAYEAEHADYTLTTDGETVLTLTNDEGSITYVKRAENSGVASGETSGETKGSPDTGAEGVAVFTALALTAGAALTLSRKR